MNQAILAQARRFYHHVVNGGQLRPEDVSYMVSALEEAYDNCTGPESAEVTITRAEYKLFQRLTKIWFHSSEKSDSFFICGEGGDHDENGLPDIILVCPHHGINITAIYEKKHVGKSGQ